MSDQESEKPKHPFINIELTPEGYHVTGIVSDMGEVYKMLGLAQDFFRAGFAKQAQIQRVNSSGGLIHRLRNGHL